MSDRTTDYEHTNRAFWDDDADDYQAAHESQLERRGRWGVWGIPESEINAVGDVAGLDVLELGCGGAQHAIGVARAARRRVGLDLSIGQLRHAVRNLAHVDLRMPLVSASGTATPFRDASFDVVFCDHGAMSFCDPVRHRAGSRATPPSEWLARLQRFDVVPKSVLPHRRPRCGHHPHAVQSPYFGARMFDWGDGTIDFQIPHGEWISLFRANDLVVDDLIELRPPADAITTYDGYATVDWACQWPAEEIWKVRRT